MLQSQKDQISAKMFVGLHDKSVINFLGESDIVPMVMFHLSPSSPIVGLGALFLSLAVIVLSRWLLED